MISRYLYIAFLLLILSCGGGKSTSTSTIPSKTPEQLAAEQELDELNSEIMLKGATAPANPSDYVIGPADLLEIEVFEVKNLSDEVRVSSTGKITLPLIGSVYVEDLSAREAELKIQKLYVHGGYLKDPHVSVFVKEYKSKLVSVIGSVEEPGTYELIGRQTLLEALALSQGLTEDAGRSAYITRIQKDGSRQSFVVDLDNLTIKYKPELNIDIQPGDIIYVPQAGNVFLEGAIAKRGSINIKQGRTTLSQVVAMAGGLRGYANPKDIKIIRYLGDGQREMIVANLKDIREGVSQDPILKDRDAIIFGASGTKKFFQGLNISLGYGLVGFGYDAPE